MDTIEKDIQELKILFNTSPKLYEKADFQKLIHVIEHLSQGGQAQPDPVPDPTPEPTPDPVPAVKDHPQFRNDIQNAVTKRIKKGKIKFTDDGYAICDKASSQNTTFHVGERIWLNPAAEWWNGLIIEDNSKQTSINDMEINLVLGDLDYHIVLFYIDYNGKWQCKDYGRFKKVFTYRLNSKYSDGKKEKVVINKRLQYGDNHFVAPENLFQYALQRSNLFFKNTIELNKGVRIYIKQSQCQHSNNGKFYDRKDQRNRFKYYRYGNLGSKRKGSLKWWNGADYEGINPHKSKFESLIEYLNGVKVGGPKIYNGDRHASRYIECIVDHYQFKKGITYRYKFRVYRVLRWDIENKQCVNYRQAILLR